MGLFKPTLLFLVLLLVISCTCQNTRVAEARPLPSLPQQRYTKVLGTLGLVCKCCDGGVEGVCTSTWVGSCSKLQCFPWKLQY